MGLKDPERMGKDEEDMAVGVSQIRISVMPSPQFINWSAGLSTQQFSLFSATLHLTSNGSRSLILTTQEAQTQAWPITGPYLLGFSAHVTQAGSVITLLGDLYIVLEEFLSMWKSSFCSRKRHRSRREFEMN